MKAELPQPALRHPRRHGAPEGDPGRAGRGALPGRLLQPALPQHSALLQQRVGGGRDVGLDALQVAHDVELHAAGLDGGGVAVTDALEMALGCDALELAELLLLGDEPSAAFRSPPMEDRDGELHVIDQALVHGIDLGQALGGELQPVLDALGPELLEVLVDDVADMLEVDGEAEDLGERGSRRRWTPRG